MKIKIHLLLIAMAICLPFASQTTRAGADEVDFDRVFGAGQRCDHVIRLVLQHGVNNSVNLHSHDMLHHAGFGTMVVPASEIGDLQLKRVTRIQHSDPACGPKFAVVIHNASSREVCDLRVTAVGLLGRICPTSPTTVTKVQKILPGQSLEVQVALPIEALTMGSLNETTVGFRRLLFAIDSYDQFVETNEANNIKVFDLSSIPVAIAAPTAAETPIQRPVQPATVEAIVDPVQATPPAVKQTQPVVAAPATTQTEGPGGEAIGDDVRSAMRKMNAAKPQEANAAMSL